MSYNRRWSSGLGEEEKAKTHVISYTTIGQLPGLYEHFLIMEYEGLLG